MKSKKMRQPLIDYDEENGFFAISVKDIIEDLTKMDILIDELKYNKSEHSVDIRQQNNINNVMKKIRMSLNGARDFIQTTKDRQAIDKLKSKLVEYSHRYQDKREELEDDNIYMEESGDEILLETQENALLDLEVERMDEFVDDRQERIKNFKQKSKQIHDIALDIHTEIHDHDIMLDSMNKNLEDGVLNLGNANENLEELSKKMKMRKCCIKVILCLMIFSLMVIVIFLNKLFT